MIEIIDEVIDTKKKIIIKKEVLESRILVFVVGLVFELLYLCFYLLTCYYTKTNITIGILIVIVPLIICICMIVGNVIYINNVFKKDYNGDSVRFEYNICEDYIIIVNKNINKEVKIYYHSIKHIFHKKHCLIILTKDRKTYMVTNKVSLNILNGKRA